MLSGLENPVHLLIVFAVLFVVFGAKRLPEMGRSIGSGMRGFKDALTSEPLLEVEAPTAGPRIEAGLRSSTAGS
jgi:sec-independent protein translocase protein TatA